MNRTIVILFLIVAAAFLLQAEASGKSGFGSIPGPNGSVSFSPGTDARKVEDKMTEALNRLDFLKRVRADENKKPPASMMKQAELPSNPPVNSTQDNSTSSNSTSSNSILNNKSLNNSLINSSLPSSLPEKVTDANEDLLNAGASSNGRLNGYYGFTASRHEIGKSGIDSRMFLSGNFEMDNTVKFQDQGVD